MDFLVSLGQAYDDEPAALQASRIEWERDGSVDEFGTLAPRALATGSPSCEPGRQYTFMEVRGHTDTIYQHGLEDYLPWSRSTWCTAPAVWCV